jgi:hypothetical protein
MEHIQHYEPNGRRFAETAEERRKCGAKLGGKVFSEGAGSKRTQPDDRNDDEVNSRHAGTRKHGPGDVAVRIDGLANVAGRGLKGWSRKSDEVESGH